MPRPTRLGGGCGPRPTAQHSCQSFGECCAAENAGGPPPELSDAHGVLPAVGPMIMVPQRWGEGSVGAVLNYGRQPPIAMRCVTSCRPDFRCHVEIGTRGSGSVRGMAADGRATRTLMAD